MKLLTFMQLAETKSEITFGEIQQHMQLGENEVEEFLIDCKFCRIIFCNDPAKNFTHKFGIYLVLINYVACKLFNIAIRRLFSLRKIFPWVPKNTKRDLYLFSLEKCPDTFSVGREWPLALSCRLSMILNFRMKQTKILITAP